MPEYSTVLAHMRKFDPEIVDVYLRTWDVKLSMLDAERYARALCDANDRKLNAITWRKNGGRAFTAEHRLSLDSKPTLGLVLHEVAHLVNKIVPLGYSRKRVRLPLSGRVVVRRHGARFQSRGGQYVHHGPSFARVLAELTRQVV